MPLRIDLHVHTRRGSPCSAIDPLQLPDAAVRAGLDGVVITEHEYQWTQDELDDLSRRTSRSGLLLLAGFEFETSQGHLLVYGLHPDDVRRFTPGLRPKDAAELVHELGGACVAAHPTRAGQSFDGQLLETPLDAIEVASSRLAYDEQRIAFRLARDTEIPMVAGSDAHALRDIGCYVTEFDACLQSAADLRDALRHGTFQAAADAAIRTGRR